MGPFKFCTRGKCLILFTLVWPQGHDLCPKGYDLLGGGQSGALRVLTKDPAFTSLSTRGRPTWFFEHPEVELVDFFWPDKKKSHQQVSDFFFFSLRVVEAFVQP